MKREEMGWSGAAGVGGERVLLALPLRRVCGDAWLEGELGAAVGEV